MTDKKYEIFDELEGMAVRLDERRKQLFQERSEVEKEILDIQHYMEFHTFSASKGYELSKYLKERLVKRREIKNEIDVINGLSASRVCDIYRGKGRDILQKIESKTYTPRILKDLFEEEEK